MSRGRARSVTFLVIPAVRHNLEALDDSVVLLTVRADSRDGIQ